MLSPIVAGVWRMASWNWSPPERLRWIEQCLELGVTSFDHADIYGGYAVEALFGDALALSPALRQRMQLVTKCGIQLRDAARPATRIKHYDTSARHIVRSVEQSLVLLRTDTIDLLLLHRPAHCAIALRIAHNPPIAIEYKKRIAHYRALPISPAT